MNSIPEGLPLLDDGFNSPYYAWCPYCLQTHEVVRPGKSQPTCDCESAIIAASAAVQTAAAQKARGEKP